MVVELLCLDAGAHKQDEVHQEHEACECEQRCLEANESGVLALIELVVVVCALRIEDLVAYLDVEGYECGEEADG